MRRIQVTLDELSTEGLKDANIERRFRDLSDEFDSCIRSAVGAGKRSVGTASFVFTVAKSGRIAGARTVDADLDKDLVDCIEKKVMSMSQLRSQDNEARIMVRFNLAADVESSSGDTPSDDEIW